MRSISPPWLKLLYSTLICIAPIPLQAAAPSTSTSPTSKPKPAEEAKKKEAAVQKKKREEGVRQELKQKLSSLKAKESGTIPYQGDEVVDVYAYPGVILLQGGRWVGSDNVYNISKHIAVAVDLSGPTDDPNFAVKSEAIRLRVRTIFQEAGITPYHGSGASSGGHGNVNWMTYDPNTRTFIPPEGEDKGADAGKPPLPVFMIVIIAEPINKGYAIYCAANLFEEVDMKRAQLEEGTWQAITWERQHLIITPTEELPYHLGRCVDDLAYSFVKLYRYFETNHPKR